MIPILQVKRLRHRGLKELVQGSTENSGRASSYPKQYRARVHAPNHYTVLSPVKTATTVWMRGSEFIFFEQLLYIRAHTPILNSHHYEVR